MILVVGGIASGKRAWVKSFGYRDDEVADATLGCGALSGHPVIANAQELVRQADADAKQVAEDLAREAQVVLCVEVGSGIVPLDPAERAWRERAGVLSRELAHHAAIVVRMVCGIPQALKGELPSTQGPELVIVRHGSTAGNTLRQYVGATDEPLCPQGEQESIAAGVHPEIDRVFVSPLLRARRTAELCFPNARQQVVEDLREMDFGDFEGRSANDMEHDEAYRRWVDGGCVGTCPHGEGQDEFVERVARGVTAIVRDAWCQGVKRAIVVAHGGTIMAALCGLGDPAGDYYGWQVGVCEGYRAHAEVGEAGVVLKHPVRFSDLGFLEPDAQAPQAGHSFFANRACRYFPCHEGIEESSFNCLFCYCPLYALGPRCGGDFTYTESGRKNCAACNIPHRGEDGAKLVASRYEELAALARDV